MRWQSHPVIYEINTVVWLRDLGHRFGRPVTLGDVPAEAWDEVALPGVDVVWLMGVWERSPAGLSIAQANEELRRSWREALPDVRPEDVVGSPYCVRGYVVDQRRDVQAGRIAHRASDVAHGHHLASFGVEKPRDPRADVAESLNGIREIGDAPAFVFE